MVDFVADEERSRADDLVKAHLKGDSEAIEAIEEDMAELNPFWAKFLNAEKVYGVSANEVAPVIESHLQKIDEVQTKKHEAKDDRRAKEMQKIMALE